MDCSKGRKRRLSNRTVPGWLAIRSWANAISANVRGRLNRASALTPWSDGGNDITFYQSTAAVYLIDGLVYKPRPRQTMTVCGRGANGGASVRPAYDKSKHVSRTPRVSSAAVTGRCFDSSRETTPNRRSDGRRRVLVKNAPKTHALRAEHTTALQ